MLPIGNLTVFLSVPPSYQYLHSPFIFHHSPFTIHHSPFAHSPAFLLVFFGKAPFYPKSTRRIIEQHPKESGNEVDKSGQTWTNVVRTGQTWTNMDKGGQNWTNVDKHGQKWSNLVRTGQITQSKCLVFSCVISLGNHSKKNIVWQKLKKESLVDFREK